MAARPSGRTDSKNPIIVLNYETGKIRRFKSYAAAAEVLGVRPHTLACRFASGGEAFSMRIPDFRARRMVLVRVVRVRRSRG